jgi:hypothetical protein
VAAFSSQIGSPTFFAPSSVRFDGFVAPDFFAGFPAFFFAGRFFATDFAAGAIFLADFFVAFTFALGLVLPRAGFLPFLGAFLAVGRAARFFLAMM